MHERFEINLKLTLNIGFLLWPSSTHKFSLDEMASEVQKPLAKMEFLLDCG